jgi:hypothetical protein
VLFLTLCGFLVGVASFSSAGVVLFRDRRNLINISWAVFSVLVGFWGIGFGITGWVGGYESALFWAKIHNLIAIFIPISFYCFTVMFVRKFKNRIAPISFGLGATVAYFMGCLWWPTKFVSGVAIPSFSTGYYALAGPLYVVFPVLYGIFAGAGLWELIRQLDQFTGHRKSQLNLLLWGFIFGFSGGGTTFFGVFGFHIAPFGVPGVVLYECLVAYAITKHELMGIKIVINKAGAFLVTALIFGLAYLGIILPYRTYVSTAIDLSFVLLSTAYCIFLVGLYFHRVQRFLQTSAYKKFLKFDYDFDETLKSVSSKLILAQNTEDVIDTMMLMQDSLEIGQCYAFLRKDETSSEFECYRIERTKNDQEKPDKTLLGTYDASHPFLAWLEEHFDKVKRIETLDSAAQKFLETLGVSADSICMSIDSFKAFQAVFIIGQRLNEERYQDKDLALFEVIANQAVIVFERITQARRLMGQQAKLEKLNVQLQASNIELESKVKEAVALAQKHFHQAAFATLTSGMAHEIRNPMAAILGTAQFLAEAMDARYEGPSKPLVGEAAMVWNRPITSDDFVGLLNGDREKAASIFGALVDHGFISPEGVLTGQVDIVSGDLSNLDLGPSFVGDAVFIESMMKRLAQTTLLIEFINVVSHHIPRLLEITESRMRCGIRCVASYLRALKIGVSSGFFSWIRSAHVLPVRSACSPLKNPKSAPNFLAPCFSMG